MVMQQGVSQIDGDAVAHLVRRATVPVMVEFGAMWCAPCRRQAAISLSVARQMGRRVEVYRVDIETSRQAAARFNIHSIPTLILFADGTERDRFVGTQPATFLVAALDRLFPQPHPPDAMRKEM